MSRAFVKEDAEQPPLVRSRAPLPDGVRNYVTLRGLALLRTELESLFAELGEWERVGGSPSDGIALRARIAELEQRLASAEPVDTAGGSADVVRFGARVRVRSSDGSERSHRMVGVDEANAAEGRVAFVAPLARALLGRRAGEIVSVNTPRGEDELEVVAIDFEPEVS